MVTPTLPGKQGSGPNPRRRKTPARLEPAEGPSSTRSLPAGRKTTANPTCIPWPELPGYELLEFVAGGGQGEVYRARQLNLDRCVAVKILREAAAEDLEQQLARFRREGKLFARMHHPHIVDVYDCGEWRGRPYLVMEYVGGGSLKDVLARRAPIPPDTAAQLVMGLADAMHHAHENGIIHRDLKPANVLLTLEGTPKITDFGLAKQLLDDATWQTRSFAILGSACYMAPEQAAGRTKDMGPRTDVWALGAILYEALTGRPPFRGETWLETLDQVRFQPVLSPSQAVPVVPPRIERVCLKCLEKEPARRYASAAELADDLRRYLAGEPVLAGDSSPANVAVGRLRRSLEPYRKPKPSAPNLVCPPDSDSGSGYPKLVGYTRVGPLGTCPPQDGFHARHARLNKEVAVKFAPAVADPSGEFLRARQLSEALGRLGHPAVAEVNEVAVGAGRVFVAREYATAGTLADRPPGQPLPPRAAAVLVEVVARGLGAAHAVGVAHGHVKPANVLLSARLSAPPGVSASTPAPAALTPFPFNPRLADFHGLGTWGSPAGGPYSSPEGEVSAAGDVWSLGAVLYELVTGRVPVGRRPARPVRVRPGVPRMLDAVCARCLTADPARRYESAVDLADDLKRFLDGQVPRAAGALDRLRRMLFGD